MRTEINYIDSAPLATFRILFGLLMFISLVRFWANGWIEKLYILPSLHFKYYGFAWVKVPPSYLLYALFLICMVSALSFAIGFKYRFSIIVFFLSFTYIELMDKTSYLNHYYFISVLSLAMIFIPAESTFSYDAWKDTSYRKIPKFYLNSLKLLIAIVYIYAGLAKLNYDWMIRAMPLSIWLPSKYHLPILGELLQHSWTHYAFSWLGAFYDLFIVFFLLNKKTRVIAFFSVVVFHLLTGILFPIGMFPYIMIASTLVFFSPEFHSKVIAIIANTLRIDRQLFLSKSKLKQSKLKVSFLTLLILFQIALPLRFLMYPGKLFWTEQGYRFSWRVMLIEKTGYAQFKVQDKISKSFFMVDNSDFLTPFQEKQMATQPDIILEYAHFLGRHFAKQGHKNLAIYVDSYASLNGSKSKRFIKQSKDLLSLKDSFAHKDWILPFNE